MSEHSLTVAQSLAGSLEQALNEGNDSDAPYAVAFRPKVAASPAVDQSLGKGRLAEARITQLIQLLEARSRASDALPSLKYVEDPRASLAAVATTRHHFIYGRRGVGKTSLLLEAKRVAEREG
ncbi:hypothetical protein, partial [Actinoplanes philippinensis]|uniref:hypothetical protein n=1 Tax=Actinoplanes philippinensis TaxID=35752 RepID=UPI0033F8FDB2